MNKTFFAKNWYYILALFISLLLGFWVFKLQFVSNFPWLYFGNADAISGIDSIGKFWSNINFGEPKTLDLWLYLVVFYYKILGLFGIPPFAIHAFSKFFILLIGFIYIKKLFDKYNPQSDIFIFFIAIGYLFSTYTIVNFEWSAIFLYIYWSIPFIIFRVLQNNYIGWLIFYFAIFYTSAINLPFGMFILVLGILSLYIFHKINFLKLASIAGVGLLVSVVGVFPSVISTFTDDGTTRFVLDSEKFYRDNTTGVSFARGIIEWGFWGESNGVPNREYSKYYNSLVGYFTFFWLGAPIFLLLSNKNRQKNNYLIMIVFLLTTMLILGNITAISGFFSEFFYSLPLSSIFRNTAKFFLILYSLILLLFIVNKNIKFSSFLFFLSGIITFFLIIFAKAIPHGLSHNYQIPNEYHQIYKENILTPKNRVLLLPTQYFGVYNFGDGIKTFAGFRIPELYWNTNLVFDRCIGCGNPLYFERKKTIVNIDTPSWKKNLIDYGIDTIVFDDNTDKNYYNSTITRKKFEEQLKKTKLKYTKKVFGKIYIYTLTDIPFRDISFCDPSWKKKNQKGENIEVCGAKDITFKIQNNYFQSTEKNQYIQLALLFFIFISFSSIYLWKNKKS